MRRSDPYSGEAWGENPARSTEIPYVSNIERYSGFSGTNLSKEKSADEDHDVNNTTTDGAKSSNSIFSRFYTTLRRLKTYIFGDRRAIDTIPIPIFIVFLLLIVGVLVWKYSASGLNTEDENEIQLPAFVFEHPYVSSSYYLSTKSLKTLENLELKQVQPKKDQLSGKRIPGKDFTRETTTRLAIVRPFCKFDAGPLPTTFECWQSFPPCKAAAYELGEGFDEENWSMNNTEKDFDQVGSHMLKDAKADVFLFYSQTFSENDEAIEAVDTILDQYFEGGGWADCFDNIYVIEANIPPELDNYSPAQQETFYNWVNGPNRQFEAAVRIIQSGEWGEFDGFYLMEGDSIPIKSYWLDVVLSEIEMNRPFAIMGAKYNGDKWDNFYEQIPISLLDHTNGNAIYNTSHPLLERLVGQLEVEAPCPYNSIPYDYRMSQMWIEGTNTTMTRYYYFYFQ